MASSRVIRPIGGKTTRLTKEDRLKLQVEAAWIENVWDCIGKGGMRWEIVDAAVGRCLQGTPLARTYAAEKIWRMKTVLPESAPPKEAESKNFKAAKRELKAALKHDSRLPEGLLLSSALYYSEASSLLESDISVAINSIEERLSKGDKLLRQFRRGAEAQEQDSSASEVLGARKWRLLIEILCNRAALLGELERLRGPCDPANAILPHLCTALDTAEECFRVTSSHEKESVGDLDAYSSMLIAKLCWQMVRWWRNESQAAVTIRWYRRLLLLPTLSLGVEGRVDALFGLALFLSFRIGSFEWIPFEPQLIHHVRSLAQEKHPTVATVFFTPTALESELLLLLSILEHAMRKAGQYTSSSVPVAEGQFIPMKVMGLVASRHEKRINAALLLVFARRRQFEHLAAQAETHLSRHLTSYDSWFQLGLAQACRGLPGRDRVAPVFLECVLQRPGDSLPRLLLAKHCLREKTGLKKAVEMIEEWIEKYSSSAVSRVSTRMYHALGVLKGALAEMTPFPVENDIIAGEAELALATAFDRDPNDMRIAFDYSFQLAKNRSIARAIVLVNLVIENDPCNTRALLLLTLLRSVMEKPLDDMDTLSFALDEDPDAVELYICHAMLLRMSGCFEEALGKCRDGFIAWRRNQLFSPAASASRYPGGFARSVVGATSPMSLMMKANPNAAPLSETASSLRLVAKGRDDELPGDRRAARVPMDDNLLELWLCVGEVFLDQSSFQDALDAAEEAASLSSSHPGVFLLRGRIAEARDRAKEALSEYRACVSLHPSNVDCLLGVARCQMRLGQNDSAAGVIRRVLGSTAEFDRIEGWVLLGEVLRKLNRDREATEAFDTALTLEETTPIVPFGKFLNREL